MTAREACQRKCVLKTGRKALRHGIDPEPYLEPARPLKLTNIQVMQGAIGLIEFLDSINSIPKKILLTFRKTVLKCAPKEKILGFCFEEVVCDEKCSGTAFLADVGERALELFGSPCYYRMKPVM